MRKKSLLSLLMVLFLFCNVGRAEAVFVFKFDVMGVDVMESVGKAAEWAEKTFNKVKDFLMIEQIGQGFKEARDFAKSAIKYAKSVEAAYNSVKRQLYDNKLAQIKAINDDIASIKAQASSIKAEMAMIKNNIQSEIDAEAAVIAGQINTYEQNRQAYLNAAAMAETEEEKAEYMRKADEISIELKEYKKQQMSLEGEVQSLMRNATNALKQKSQALDRSIAKLQADLFALLNIEDSDKDTGKAMQGNVDLYFISPSENVTPDLMEEKRINRLIERRASIIGAYQAAVYTIPDIKKFVYESEDLSQSASTFDTLGGAAGAMAEMKVKNLNGLKLYAELLVADLKMRTAIGISGLTYYKLVEPKKDITEFNLDDYIFSPLKKGL